MLIKILFFLYSMTAWMRKVFLLTFFGFYSECKHQPSCSIYMKNQIENLGLKKGFLRGIKQLSNCW